MGIYISGAWIKFFQLILILGSATMDSTTFMLEDACLPVTQDCYSLFGDIGWLVYFILLSGVLSNG